MAASAIDDSGFEELENFDVRNVPNTDDVYEEDFLTAHGRYKQRATEAFERDLAELRQKRRDMRDKMFDMIDISAEIERAKTTLKGANTAFQRHAPKFDNSELPEPEGLSLAGKIDRDRKIAAAAAALDTLQEEQKKLPMFKWTKMQEIVREPYDLVQGSYNGQARINPFIADDGLANAANEPINKEPQRSSSRVPKERTKKQRSFLKRKKSVSF